MATKVGAIEISEKQLQKALSANAEGQNYTGAGDNLLDFGSAQSFLDEDSTAKRFAFRIVNAGASAIGIHLNDIIASIANSNVIAEGTVATDLTCTGSPRSIDVMKKFLENNPTRIRSIKLSVDNESQLDEPLRYITETPFKTGVEENRIPSDYQSQDTNNPKMVEVDDVKDWILSPESTIAYSIRAGRTVNISILFGASVDTTKALAKKADEAAQTVAAAYVRSKQ